MEAQPDVLGPDGAHGDPAPASDAEPGTHDELAEALAYAGHLEAELAKLTSILEGDASASTPPLSADAGPPAGVGSPGGDA